MVDDPKRHAVSRLSWRPRQLLVLSAVCLAAGFLAGYWLRNSAPGSVRAPVSSAPPMAEYSGPIPSGGEMPKASPSLDDLKLMADKKAAPLLAQLKSDSKNARLYNQVGLIYKSTHQFKEAAEYFSEALQYDAKNVGVRADYASCLYYTGDVDGALAQLNQSLVYDPAHAGTLMNIGIIKWRGKNDVDGAVAAWERLLQLHPDFPQKDLIQQMITQAKQSAKTTKPGEKG